MKIKNIFDTAFLKLCLVLFALIPAIAAVIGATHTPTVPQPSGETISGNLKAVGDLSISVDGIGPKGGSVPGNTYFDNDTWYKYGNTQNITSKNSILSFSFKYGDAIVVKLNPGNYKLSITYYSENSDGGVWYHLGDNYEDGRNNAPEANSSKYSGGTKNTSFDFSVSEEQCLWISGLSGTAYLSSVKIESKTALPSDIETISTDKFWYHNGDNGFSRNGLEQPFYMYFNQSSAPYAPTSGKKVLINNQEHESYTIASGDGIGFKLDNKAYRIKVYYNNSGAVPELCWGADISTASVSGTQYVPSTPTDIKDGNGRDTGTCLITYEVPGWIVDNKGQRCWIKNGDSNNPVYLGGFEILPYGGSVSIPDKTFTGIRWYVEDYAASVGNANGGADVQVAQGGNNVVIDGPSMAINSFTIGLEKDAEGKDIPKKTVMLNENSKIGVNLPASATLKFVYCHDDGVSLKITDKDGNKLTPQKDELKEYVFNEVEYTATNDQKVWLTGEGSGYVYIPGFLVDNPNASEEITIADATPISSDYVWYPVKDKALFADNSLTDEHTFVVHGFNPADNDKTINKISTITFNSSLHTAYRPEGDTQIGFKIAQGKKGVINVYYDTDPKESVCFPLYRSSDGSNIGARITDYTTVNLGNAYLAQYYFDTTNGQTTYWLKRHGGVWFGGFEVLFEEGNNGGIDLASGAYNCNGNSTVINAISDDTYSILKSSDTTPVVGPSMMVNSLTEGNGVMLYTRNKNNSASDKIQNAIVFRMTGSTYNAVEVVGVVDGSSIRIYKGDPLNGGKLLGTLSSTGGNKIDLGDHTDTDVFYAVSDDDKGAYLLSLAPASLSGNQLVTINDYNMYLVNNQPYNGQILNDKHTIFIGGVDQIIEPGMMVLGQTNKAFKITNGQDFYGFKVGESVDGKTTGYIKVYFNGGTSDSHVMEELPIDVAFGAGWNSSYDKETHVISFASGGGGRGWWFGFDGDGARDLSEYNKLNIELGEITGSPNLQVVVQSSNGAYAAFPLDEKGRLLGDLTDKNYWHTNDNAEEFNIRKVSQIYIQDNNTDETTSTVEIKSARLMNKPLVIATGTIGTDQNGDETYDPANRSEVFGGIIHDVQNAHVYEFPFDLTKTDSNPQLYWVTGDINIAAIEVVYDDDRHAKVVDWYVNKDTKMIVGSDDANWVWTDFSGKNQVKYPEGYDEYVTFYMSGGRQAHVSFIMPEAIAEVVDWDKDNAAYGKHVIKPSVVNLNDKTSGFNFSLDKNDKIYDRTNQTATRNNIGTGSSNAKNLYSWYTYDCTVPNDAAVNDNNYYVGIAIKATQKPAPGDTKWNDEDIELVNGKKGEWKIYMRFVSYKAPEVNKENDILDDNSGVKVGETISITSAGQGGNIYYTSDSSDPMNLASGSSTETYNNSNFDIKKNCIVKAAQYLDTPYQFFEDATLRNNPSNSFKLVSADHNVIFDKDNVVYVKDEYPDPFPEENGQLFNRQDGGYMLTLPTGDVIDCKDKDDKTVMVDVYDFNDKKELKKTGATVAKHEQAFNAAPHMYLTLGGKDHPYLNADTFALCGTNWKASNDGGLKTYLDSYQKKFDVDGAKSFSPWPLKDKNNKDVTQNQNPYTECNGGVGGADTEEGGMFLQPIGGAMLRFEPEYDGVITVWLRQNGCLDNNDQEKGTFTRRPVYIMDENGRIMTRTTIKPTDEHYLGINGTYAINSNMCEERSQVEHTWLYAVAKQVFEKHPVYAERFKNFPNRWETDGIEHAGHVMYGWWYKGFNINATTEEIKSADHVSRYEYMEPNLLYRSDNVYSMEMNTLGLKNSFAKYGYELPNFQYVRYRIPVKAGKTYYIAGRGTKNGFSAIQFDRVKCNTNLDKGYFDALRFADNPTILENTVAAKNSSDYLKIKEEWSEVGSSSEVPSETAIAKSYDVDLNNTGTNYGNVNFETEAKDAEGNYKNCQWIVDLVENSNNITGQDNLEGKTLRFVLERTFTKGHWHPIILPFSLSETRLEQYFGEGTKVLYLDPFEHTVANSTDSDGKKFISAYNAALDNSKLYFTLHRYQMLYANTPAFICPTFEWSAGYINKKGPALKSVNPNYENIQTAGSVSSIIFHRVTIDGSNSRYRKTKDGKTYYSYAINEEYEVAGTYDTRELTGDVYYINNGTGGAQLMHSTGNTVVMRPTRVWIQPIDQSRSNAPIRQVGAKTFSELDFDYGADQAGISDIVADDVTVETYRDDNGVYDLLGRKIGEGSLEGLPAGIYIFQGKKVYVK